MDIFWLRCKNCERRGKYFADPKDISYVNNKLYLSWNLSCKFCDKSLKLENLSGMTVKELYIYLIARSLDVWYDDEKEGCKCH